MPFSRRTRRLSLRDRISRIFTSPDSSRCAQLMTKDGETALIVDGVAYSDFDAIDAQSTRFSPDSRTLAYVVRRGSKSYVVINGDPGAAYDDVGSRSIQFSPDSQRIAYMARLGDKWSVILDGRVLAIHDEIGRHTWSWDFGVRTTRGYKPFKQGVSVNWALSFSPSGEHFAYVAKDDGLWHVVLDNVAHQPYENIKPDTLTFSPNSDHLAYKAEHRGRTFVVVDNKEQRHYAELSDGPPVFSPDGKRLGYFAKQSDSWFVVLNENEGRLFDGVLRLSSTLKFSPDSNRVAYAGKGGGKIMWVVDGSVHTPCQGLGMSAFSPDSSHFIYVAARNKNRYLIFDGVEGKRYNQVGVFQLSPDSQRLAYDATVRSWGRKRRIMIVDGAKGDAYEDKFMGQAIFSPNSQRYAHRARFGKSWHVVLDGVRGKGYKRVLPSLVFSPDSERLAYMATKGKYDVVVVNGIEVNQHREVLSGEGKLVFDSPCNLHYLARDNGEFTLHEVELNP